MTISVYQVDNVIKAYNKQIKTKSDSQYQPSVDSAACYRDCVTISNPTVDKAATFKKISYNIRDIIVKNLDE